MSKHKWRGLIAWVCTRMSTPPHLYLFFIASGLFSLALVSPTEPEFQLLIFVDYEWKHVISRGAFFVENKLLPAALSAAECSEMKWRTELHMSLLFDQGELSDTHSHLHKHKTNRWDLNPPGCISSIRACAYEKIIIWWYEDTARGSGWQQLSCCMKAAAKCVPKL